MFPPLSGSCDGLPVVPFLESPSEGGAAYFVPSGSSVFLWEHNLAKARMCARLVAVMDANWGLSPIGRCGDGYVGRMASGLGTVPDWEGSPVWGLSPIGRCGDGYVGRMGRAGWGGSWLAATSPKRACVHVWRCEMTLWQGCCTWHPTLAEPGRCFAYWHARKRQGNRMGEQAKHPQWRGPT